MRVKMPLNGLDKYLKRLRDAGKDIDIVANDALVAAGQVLHPAILERTPVMEKAVPGKPAPGNLKNHIVVNGPFQVGNRHFLYVEVDLTNREMMQYAIYVEYGHGNAAPRSYIRAGVDAARKDARRVMVNIFKKAFKK